MEIQTIYQITRMQGQSSPRQYIDTRNKSQKKPQVKHKRRNTFVQEIIKSSKNLPGPGKYKINPQSKLYEKKPPKKLNFAEQAKKPSNRFIDKLLKDKQKIPAVGKYNPQVDHTEQIVKKYKIKGDRDRKQAPIFKSTIFDDNQRDMLNVGPGSYQPLKPFGQKKSFRVQVVESKQQELPIGNEKQKKPKKAKSEVKLPSVHSYTPIYQNYQTFDAMASKSSTSQANANTFTTAKRRLSVQNNIGPGPKYSLIADWSPRKDKPLKNMFKSTSTLRQPSVYH